MNIRVVSLVCAAALSLIASQMLLTFGVVAQTPTVAMDGGGSTTAARPVGAVLSAAEPDPAEQSARSIECAQKADAQRLEGKPRKHFLHTCRSGV